MSPPTLGCARSGSRAALQRAKYTAEFGYAVVGLAEHWNASLAVLEHYVPAFFTGAHQRYWSQGEVHEEGSNSV